MPLKINFILHLHVTKISYKIHGTHVQISFIIKLQIREYGWQDPTTKLQGHFTAHMVQREVISNVKCQFEQMQTVIFGKHRTT